MPVTAVIGTFSFKDSLNLHEAFMKPMQIVKILIG